MINLLKKDIRACFKTDFKMIIKLLVGIVIFSTILMPFSTVAIPLFLSYIFIIKSFQIFNYFFFFYIHNFLFSPHIFFYFFMSAPLVD